MVAPIPRKLIKKISELYHLGNVVNYKFLGGGIINKTYYIKNEGGEEFIVQKLHSAFQKNLTQDIYVITQYLLKKQWICSELLRTKDANTFCEIDRSVWRVYRYVRGESFSTKCIQGDLYRNIGSLLGLLHKDLKAFEYTPKHILNGFHDGNFYIQKARRISKGRYSEKLQGILEDVLVSMEHNSNILSKNLQFIHGDPKVENVIYTDHYKPFTFIDYDTFMIGSVFIDIGDCLRSLLGLSSDTDNINRIEEFLTGYNSVDGDEVLLYDDAVLAVKYITLELCLRFIIDSVEKTYFSWDSTRYVTQEAHNEARALAAWNLFCSLSQSL